MALPETEEQVSKDVGEKSIVRKRKKAAKLLLLQEIEETRRLLETPGGRWFLWRLLEECGVYRTFGVQDSHSMAMLSGRRDIGLWIIGKVFEANPNGYRLLMEEQKERDIDA
jgi:hypothetical protein